MSLLNLNILLYRRVEIDEIYRNLIRIGFVRWFKCDEFFFVQVLDVLFKYLNLTLSLKILDRHLNLRSNINNLLVGLYLLMKLTTFKDSVGKKHFEFVPEILDQLLFAPFLDLLEHIVLLCDYVLMELLGFLTVNVDVFSNVGVWLALDSSHCAALAPLVTLALLLAARAFV